MSKPHLDPERARMLEMLERLSERTGQLREYSMIPGDAWLAKGELGNISQMVSELETLLEQIKQQDAENGY